MDVLNAVRMLVTGECPPNAPPHCAAMRSAELRLVLGVAIAVLVVALFQMLTAKRRTPTPTPTPTRPARRQGPLKVSSLKVHPVKSCRGVSVDSVALDEYGISGDRRFMVVKDDPSKADKPLPFVSQREKPLLALVAPVYEGKTLRVCAPGQEDIVVQLFDPDSAPGDDELVKVSVWDDVMMARLVSDQADAFFTQYLRREYEADTVRYRLVAYAQGHHKRPLEEGFASKDLPVTETVFADGYPILIASVASLDDTNAHLTKKVAMENFRPNIVIDGCEGFSEDQWTQIEIGSTTMSVVKQCERCSIPNVDQTTGEKSKTDQPRKTLIETHSVEKRPMFGMNAVPHCTRGTIRVGDTVTVLQSK